MRWFLKLVYTTGPEAGKPDYVGPFPSEDAANYHKSTYGPVESTVVQEDLATVRENGYLDPSAHITYVQARQ